MGVNGHVHSGSVDDVDGAVRKKGKGKLVPGLIGTIGTLLPFIPLPERDPADAPDAERDFNMVNGHVYSGSVDDVDGAVRKKGKGKLVPGLIGTIGTLLPFIPLPERDHADAPDAEHDSNMVNGHVYSGSVDDVDGAMRKKGKGKLVSGLIGTIGTLLPFIPPPERDHADAPDAEHDSETWSMER